MLSFNFFIKKSILLFLLVPLPVMAQMPGWIKYNDMDGNSFLIDQNGKFYLEEKPDFDYKAVAIEGFPYYIKQAKDLIANHYKKEGATLLKSIIYLSDLDKSLYAQGSEASKELNRLIAREGDRWIKLDLETSLHFARTGEINHIFLQSGIEFQIPFKAVILKKSVRAAHSYIRDSFRFGINLESEKTDFYSAVFSVVSETVPYNFESAETYRNFALKKTIPDNYTREEVSSSRNRIMNYFYRAGDNTFAGYEIFEVNANTGFYIQAYFSPRGGNKNKVKQILENTRIKGINR
ncbi:MAG: hypothetical protein KAZ87_01260 [Spirochaetes bacterium]|nr:hypothetical protein [Spirochaetota bacterium]